MMSPSWQIQRLLGEIPSYEATAVVELLPLVAALQSALHTRILTLQLQAALPETDYLLNVDEIAKRLGKSAKWVRSNTETLPFIFQLGSEYRCSARWLDEWINEQGTTRIGAALSRQRSHHAR